MLVAAGSRPVATEWITVKETTSTNDRFVTYAAPSTIRKTGTTVKMWSMMESMDIQGTPSDRPHFSWIDDWEYDCEGKRLRPLEFRAYSGKMGTGGNVLSQNSVELMMAVNPGSVGEALWKIACGKE